MRVEPCGSGRQLTEVVSRHLHAFLASEDGSDVRLESAPPLTVFLSHAKKDGISNAQALRDEIFGYGQIKAFYDENDLPIGAVFGNALKDAAKGKSTAAMLAIVTDAYAGRPWCRAEVSLARTPTEEANYKNRWFIQPLVAVDALEKERTRGVPEIGNAPTVRWREGAETEILDLLMLESLLFAFHRLGARSIASGDRRHVINWVPDPPTLFALASHFEKSETEANKQKKDAKKPPIEIVYPGYGLPKPELETYERFLGNAKLKTFEEARDEPNP